MQVPNVGEIRVFSNLYANRYCGEDKEAKVFWMQFFNLWGVQVSPEFCEFEKRVSLENGGSGKIDCYIKASRVLIEHKSSDVDLERFLPFHGGQATPYQQAKQYANALTQSEYPRYIVTCNFSEIWIYDLNKAREARGGQIFYSPIIEPDKIRLSDLESQIHRLRFMVDASVGFKAQEEVVSVQAASLIGELYVALADAYKQGKKEDYEGDLNRLCTRIAFCLYAEDAGLFEKDMFSNYLNQGSPGVARRNMLDVFRILDIDYDKRSSFEDPDLLRFPYVNGGLFEGANEQEVPQFTDKIRELIVKKCGLAYDWSPISPTIYGALFESTLNKEVQRKGGMHYTSQKNIHKVIDPLFLDDFKRKYAEIEIANLPAMVKYERLAALQTEMASKRFLDPACGSGNFLTETYLSLRRIENRIIKEGARLGYKMGVKVSIGNFYGIEINDFAVVVARTAMWIAEHQMRREMQGEGLQVGSGLPLSRYNNIIEGNALRVDWREIGEVDYVVGNPPFVGTKKMTDEHKADVCHVFANNKGAGVLDYVTCWFKKAAEYMQTTNAATALVATNSICQGEQVPVLWKLLIEIYGIDVCFAHKSFEWENEAADQAAVFCVIIGMVNKRTQRSPKLIYENENVHYATNINPYLLDAPTLFIERTKKQLNTLPAMSLGSFSVDGGNLLLSPEERTDVIMKDPKTAKYIKRYVSSDDLIYNDYRYCFWLENCSPEELASMPEVKRRIAKVAEHRLASKKAATRKAAATPHLFTERRQPRANFIMIPRFSTTIYEYMPSCYFDTDTVPNGNSQVVQNATLATFAVLNSKVYTWWARTICGRIGYVTLIHSSQLAYNNFPMPELTQIQEDELSACAQAILDARALYPKSNLAQLYHPHTMPEALRLAHLSNDRAVMNIFGFSEGMSEGEVVGRLMERYQGMVGENS